MKVKKIYNNNKAERHFKWLSLKEKVMVMIERVILKLKNTYKFLKIEKIISNIYFKKTFFRSRHISFVGSRAFAFMH